MKGGWWKLSRRMIEIQTSKKKKKGLSIWLVFVAIGREKLFALKGEKLNDQIYVGRAS